MHKITVFYFGNPGFEEDRLALEIGDELSGKVKGAEFVRARNLEELLDYEENEILILDVAKGLKEVKMLDADSLKKSRICSAHDFDLGFFLKIISELGIKPEIIGIPQKGDKEKIKNKVKGIIESFTKSNAL